MNNATLILFAKYPTPGHAKTRLIPILGPEGAARVAEAFLLDLLEILNTWPPPPPDLQTRDKNRVQNPNRILFFAPRTAEASFKELLTREQLQRHWTLRPQSSGDLGERLNAALTKIQTETEGPVLFLGMDCLEFPSSSLSEALGLARTGKIVVRPARDGGYVMLALPAGTPPEIFNEIRWSTAFTCSDQIARAHALGIPIESIGTSMDVDEPEDLREFWHRIKSTPIRYPRTWKTLQSMHTLF